MSKIIYQGTKSDINVTINEKGSKEYLLKNPYNGYVTITNNYSYAKKLADGNEDFIHGTIHY